MGQTPWTTIHRNALPGTVEVRTWLWNFRNIEINVVGDEEIEVAIAVVVQKRAASPPSGVLVVQSGFFGDVSKGSVAVVPIKFVLTVVGAEQVLKSVIVIVPNAYGGRPSGGRQTGRFCYVGEGPVAG